ncbi:alpha/beta hydrolase [Isoptericola sp. F-RaC21]|uniref:alpha/beta hydrolase n=1 Tax=Isoptericola sp. F-RaC21 TaxID=3141452 RepID=UPI00315BF9C1
MGPRVLRDIVYATRPGFRPLSLDLHLPADPHPPVVVFVHGGGWRQGSRRVFCPGRGDDETFGRITGRGWAVVAADYRLSGEAVFPAALDDVRAAVRWVRETGAAEHGLDADRTVLWGESAGGHLAALAALVPSDGGPAVRAVVDWYGPSDLTTLPQGPEPDGGPTREAALLGGPVGADRERALAASPAHHVHAGAPPFLLAHGVADSAVPFAQSEAFAARLRAAGVDVELHAVPGAGHLWRGVDDLGTVVDPALRFIEDRVAGP